MEAYDTGPIQGLFPPLEAFASDNKGAIHHPATQTVRVIRTLDPISCADWAIASALHFASVRE